MAGDSGQTGLLRSRVSRRDVKGRILYSALDSKVKPCKPHNHCVFVFVFVKMHPALNSKVKHSKHRQHCPNFLHCLSFTGRNIPLSAAGLFFLSFSTLQCGGLCLVQMQTYNCIVAYCVLCWEWCFCYLSRIAVWYCVLLVGWLQYCRV